MKYSQKYENALSNAQTPGDCQNLSSLLGNQQMLRLISRNTDGRTDSHSPVQRVNAAEKEPLQRIISILGRNYTTYDDLDTATFQRVFRGHPQYLPRLSQAVADNLDTYMSSPAIYGFNSFRALLNACLPLIGNTLNVTPAFIHGGSAAPMAPFAIAMSGTRIGDYILANVQMGFHATPAGFTWHHIEGIFADPAGTGNLMCNMVLVQTAYHAANHHNGGVHEYEMATGLPYG